MKECFKILSIEIGLVVTAEQAGLIRIFGYHYQLAPQEHCDLLANLPISISSDKEI